MVQRDGDYRTSDLTGAHHSSIGVGPRSGDGAPTKLEGVEGLEEES